MLALYTGTTNVSPVGVADSYSTAQGQPLSVPAPGSWRNDTDAESNALTAGDVTQPAHGVVSLAANGSFTYVPDEGYCGTDTFTYKANDGTSTSAATTVTITVSEAPNTAPEADGRRLQHRLGRGDVASAAPGVLTNDTDGDGDALTRDPHEHTGQRRGHPAGRRVLHLHARRRLRGQGPVHLHRERRQRRPPTPATVTITVKPAGGTGGGPLTSAVAGAAAPLTYGKLGTVVASVAPAAATGKVEVLQGNDLVASGVLASGRATLVLPAKSLLPGTHQLTLRYVGDGGHKASSSTVEVTVDKVVPRMTVKAPSTVKKGKAPKVTVILRAPDGVPVTGTVSIAIKGGKTLTGTLDGGRVVVKLPAVRKKTKLTVTYQGSGLAESVVDTATIRIRR